MGSAISNERTKYANDAMEALSVYSEDAKEEKELEEEDYSSYLSATSPYKQLLKECDQLGYTRTLSQEEANEYVEAAQAGDMECRDLMVMHNLRLVVNVASRFVYFAETMDMDDLVQEGVCGLIKAIERFDTSRGLRFSTYAIIWIQQSISRSLENSGTIRIPVYVHVGYYKYQGFIKRHIQETGKTPTPEELKVFCKENNLSYEMMQWVVDNHSLVSLNQRISTDEKEDSELGDFIADTSASHSSVFGDISKVVENKALREDLQRVMDMVLKPIEKEVIVRRFGLGCEPQTLEEIGKDMNVTRERVRQREAKALRKLRQSYRAHCLREWVS